MSQQGGGQQPQPSGPPYLPQIAQLGGQPTPKVDDPISAVLLVFFITGAVINMTIFQVNRKRDHKFVFSAMTFGFCMARITALTMRIVWASRPTNINIAIAANIFTQAGVLLLFVINLVFAHRMVRAYHPHFGWLRAVSLLFKFFYFSVVALLIMVITATVLTFFTLDTDRRRICRDIQLFAGTYLAALAFLPIPIVSLAALIPRKGRVEKFGQGRFRTKLRLLLFTATLLALGAGFRIGVNFDIRPISHPAWYHHKACYYCFNYVIEIIVVYTYALARFDRRFHVPNGSSGPGDYAGGMQRTRTWEDRINREADVFGDDTDTATANNFADTEGQREQAWEAQARDELEKERPGSQSA